MARPKIHDAATAEVLLDAAMALLRAGGLDAVSLRAVADASERSMRAVYALFGSKQALIDALAARGYATLSARVNALPRGGDAAEELVAVGAEGFRSFAIEDPQMFRLTFEQVSAEVLQQPQVAKASWGAYTALASRVSAARDAGAIHESRTDVSCVFAFHSLCQGLAAGELSARPAPDGAGFWPMLRGTDLEEEWRIAIGALVRGFAEPVR